jgi:hypothetical protein
MFPLHGKTALALHRFRDGEFTVVTDDHCRYTPPITSFFSLGKFSSIQTDCTDEDIRFRRLLTLACTARFDFTRVNTRVFTPGSTKGRYVVYPSIEKTTASGAGSSVSVTTATSTLLETRRWERASSFVPLARLAAFHVKMISGAETPAASPGAGAVPRSVHLHLVRALVA